MKKSSNYQEVMQYYKSSHLQYKLRIIYKLLQVPALLIHELAHQLMVLLLFFKYSPIQCKHFFKVEDDTLHIASFYVVSKVNRNSKIDTIKSLLISIAPLFGMIILLLINWYFIIWILLSWDAFYLSDSDIDDVKYKFNLLLTQLKLKN